MIVFNPFHCCKMAVAAFLYPSYYLCLMFAICKEIFGRNPRSFFLLVRTRVLSYDVNDVKFKRSFAVRTRMKRQYDLGAHGLRMKGQFEGAQSADELVNTFDVSIMVNVRDRTRKRKGKKRKGIVQG